MAGEEKFLNKDLKEVLREMSKAPGGNVAQPRPVVPGGIGGNIPMGTVDITTGERRPPADIARDLFRFYKTGAEPVYNVPEDTRTVTVTEQEVSEREKNRRAALKKSGAVIQETKVKKETKQAVREAVGGPKKLTRPSLPAPYKPVAVEIAIARAKTRAELESIRAFLEHSAIEAYKSERGITEVTTPEQFRELKKRLPAILSREEQKVLDRIATRIADALMEYDARLKEKLAAEGKIVSEKSEAKAMREADKRTLPVRQDVEQQRVSKMRPPTTVRPSMGGIPPIMPGGGLLDQTK